MGKISCEQWQQHRKVFISKCNFISGDNLKGMVTDIERCFEFSELFTCVDVTYEIAENTIYVNGRYEEAKHSTDEAINELERLWTKKSDIACSSRIVWRSMKGK